MPCVSQREALAEQLEAAASAECQRMQQGQGLVQGRLASSSSTIADLSSESPSEIALLCTQPVCSTADAQDTKQEAVTGRLVLTGVLYARAMVNRKDTLAVAVDLIKVEHATFVLIHQASGTYVTHPVCPAGSSVHQL